MSALTDASNEEITDTLLAARERIEHLTICGAALQAENDRLKAALWSLYKATPTLLSCADFHHAKKDQHQVGDICEPSRRYVEAQFQAAVALGVKT